MSADFKGLAAELLQSSERHVSSWLSAGKRQGKEWVVGSLSNEPGTSLSINLNNGRWADFASGETGGDLIDLYAAIHGISMIDAYKELGGEVNPRAPRPMKPRTPAPAPEPTRRVVAPVPESVALHDCAHPKFGRPVRVWQYMNEHGELLGYVARYEPAGERKQIAPWTYDGERWGMGQWPEPRPMYGLQRLAEKPDAPVLLVAGEKAADAANALAGKVYVAMTWPGGEMAWQKTDFSPIYGRKVLIWPDADATGAKCSAALGARLLEHCPEVKILDVAGQADGWDAADCTMTWPEFRAWAKPRAAVLAPIPAAARQKSPTLQSHVNAGSDVAPQSATASPNNSASAGPVHSFPREADADQTPGPGASGGEVVHAHDAGPLCDYHTWLPNVNDKGKPLSTIENVRELCRRLGVTIRYNVISKDEEILIPGAGFSIDNKQNASLSWLISECAKFRMPVDQVPAFVTFIADQNPYNPVAMWIESKPWDGRDRLTELLGTIQAVGEQDERVSAMKRAFLTRWMISAIAGAFSPTGVSAHGVLVFQGAQYVGKTKWFKSLVPADLGVLKDGLLLRPDDRDSVMKCVSNWLVELGEIDATFRKADVAALKSFLTSDRDVLRRAYARKESTFARRTVFFASVNPKQYLHDPTGNRRYWTIECEYLDHSHSIDMQQCWAQVLGLYRAGESWFLTPDEMALLNDHNLDFEELDPIQELVATRLNWRLDKSLWRKASVTDVLAELGRVTPSKSEVTKAGLFMVELGGVRLARTNAVRRVLCPPTF